MRTMTITVPVERKDIDEQAMVVVKAEINDHDYYIVRIEDEAGNDITGTYSGKELEGLYDEVFEFVNQERSEYLIGMAESRFDR
jgi:hypothetical protein